MNGKAPSRLAYPVCEECRNTSEVIMRLRGTCKESADYVLDVARVIRRNVARIGTNQQDLLGTEITNYHVVNTMSLMSGVQIATCSRVGKTDMGVNQHRLVS